MMGTASYYGVECCKFNPHNGCPMANGQSLYEAIKDGVRYAAMWDVPFGTRLKVTGLASGKSTEVIVSDRGPAHRLNRLIDLNPHSFSEICEKKDGLCEVSLEVLS